MNELGREYETKNYRTGDIPNRLSCSVIGLIASNIIIGGNVSGGVRSSLVERHVGRIFDSMEEDLTTRTTFIFSLRNQPFY